jgi:hypothetical protein
MQAMFDASVTVEVGNGRRALLWQDRWIHDRVRIVYLRAVKDREKQ